MTPTLSLDVPQPPAPAGRCAIGTDATHDLGDAIAELAARLHAATYQLLVMLREFDARAGWNNGFLSCAHWLHWRTSIDLGACREKVRVAKALAALPLTSATMERGQLSYAKVRAITRVATKDNERRLVDVALAGTASHVERVVRAWRRVDCAEEARQANGQHLRRYVSVWQDDDGMVVIRGRLSPEVGAVVQRALEAAADALFHEHRGAAQGHELAEEVTPAQRRADALGRLAEAALSAKLDAGSAGDRYRVVLHVDAHADTAPSLADGAVLETDAGPLRVSAETSKRLSCDASRVAMSQDQGTTLDVGRRTRTVPAAIRRALTARDRHCRFPGCTSRRCDAHHVDHWMNGGSTSLDNLMLLCRRHHRAVHEGGIRLETRGDGTWFVVDPTGAVIEAAPLLPDVSDTGGLPAAASRTVVWDGTPFHLAYVVDVLRHPPSQEGLALTRALTP